MLIIQKIKTGPSNVEARLIPLEEREEPEQQHQHELQSHQEDLTQQQQLDTRKDEMQQQYVNKEHQQHNQQQDQTQTQQLTRSEKLLQQLQPLQHQQQELQKLQERNSCNHQSQPLQDSHTNASTVSNEQRNLVIFGDSILKGRNRKILGQKLFNAKVFHRFLPGTTSRDFSHFTLNQNYKNHRQI